ncbi:MAG: hypothetical protein AABY26_02975, partial [Nanoarchaeota archaeon]
LGIINDEDKLRSALEMMQAAGLDQPLPLRYTAGRENVNFILQEYFLHNYEGNTVWTHMGPLYIKLVRSVDEWQAKELKDKYTKMIESLLSYPEVLSVVEENGEKKVKPFRTPFYSCDRGMLWAANYLTL